MILAICGVIAWADIVSDFCDFVATEDNSQGTPRRPEIKWWYGCSPWRWNDIWKDSRNYPGHQLLNQLISIKVLVSIIFWGAFIWDHLISMAHFPKPSPALQYPDLRVSLFSAFMVLVAFIFSLYHITSFCPYGLRDYVDHSEVGGGMPQPLKATLWLLVPCDLMSCCGCAYGTRKGTVLCPLTCEGFTALCACWCLRSRSPEASRQRDDTRSHNAGSSRYDPLHGTELSRRWGD